MDCLTSLKKICSEMGEDIDSPLCQEVKEHLEKCPKCCAHVDSIKKVVYLYKNKPGSDVPKQVDHRLWKILNLQKPEN